MKKLLIGLLALGSVSAFADEPILLPLDPGAKISINMSECTAGEFQDLTVNRRGQDFRTAGFFIEANCAPITCSAELLATTFVTGRDVNIYLKTKHDKVFYGGYYTTKKKLVEWLKELVSKGVCKNYEIL